MDINEINVNYNKFQIFHKKFQESLNKNDKESAYKNLFFSMGMLNNISNLIKPEKEFVYNTNTTITTITVDVYKTEVSEDIVESDFLISCD